MDLRERQVLKCTQSLTSAALCRNANCGLRSCQRLKRMTQHIDVCHRFSRCRMCKPLILLCSFHARTCEDTPCAVPFCTFIKNETELKKIHSEMMQAKERQTATTPNGSSAVSCKCGCIVVVRKTGKDRIPFYENVRTKIMIQQMHLQKLKAHHQCWSAQSLISSAGKSGSSQAVPVPASSAKGCSHQPDIQVARGTQTLPANALQVDEQEPEAIVKTMRQAQPNSISIPDDQQLLRLVNLPNTPRLQQKLFEMIKSNPDFMYAVVNKRRLFQTPRIK